jgi:endonuclease/exonuclease/phosphatase family metal-dependent hydrolase
MALAIHDCMTAPSLRVLTVNAHKGFGFLNRRFILRELRDAVRAVSADVVFLQEVLGSHAHHARRLKDWPASPQYEYLADTIWSQHAYGRNAVYPHGDHGNAVLSRFPIRSYENHDASIGSEARGLLHCVLDVPGLADGVHAICVHLGLRESHRQHQLERLCAVIEREVPPGAPLVVAGDFNDWRLVAHERLYRCAGLSEVFVATFGRAARTFPARWPVLRLDRIYARHARVQPLRLPPRPWSHLSDHAPLAAQIEFKT